MQLTNREPVAGCAKQCDAMPDVENKDGLDGSAKVVLLRSNKSYYSGSGV